jgi:hypothetical protein
MPLRYLKSVVLFSVLACILQSRDEEDTQMNKTVIIAIAKISASVSAVAVAVAATQASAFDKTTSSNGSSSPRDHIVAARRELNNTNRFSNELKGMLTEHGGDPLSMDDFDVEAFGIKLYKAGMISDISSWRAAADKIESDGFHEFIDELMSCISVLDQQLDVAEIELDTWSKLGADDRMTAITGNTDHNIVPVLAKLKVDATKFDNFAQAGLLTFAELSYLDNGTGSLVGDSDDKVTSKKIVAA